ncbi:MAG TPA: glycerol-3-phosphate acyltransferase [Candidatus Bathyarchaeia archaeon]|nr:glycerol-3-phosphate acyltransferase [Candidatus Bathyarchaeia archaeon]
MDLGPLWFVIALLGSFFSGSIPYAVIIGKRRTGKDLRNFNIGNPGGFNAVMTYGLPIGLTVIFVDILKGLIPIALIDWGFSKYYLGNSIWYLLAVTLGPALCILGHNHSPFLGFKGGRGSAVFIGTLLWVNPLVLICYFLPFGIMIGLFKIPTRVSTILSAIFYIPAALFMPITAPWGLDILAGWNLPSGNPFLYMIPFFIALGMLLAQLPRHYPSLVAAAKGEEWTLKVTEGQQFSEKFETKKEEA